MHVIDHAPLEPGACFITQRSEGPFVDTGLDIDDLAVHGRVYLAVSTVSDLCDVIGGLGPEAAQILRDRIAELEETVVRQDKAIEGLTLANQALVDAGYSPAATAPEPVADDSTDPRYGGLDDDELLDAVLASGVDVAPDASREQMIEALEAQP